MSIYCPTCCSCPTPKIAHVARAANKSIYLTSFLYEGQRYLTQVTTTAYNCTGGTPTLWTISGTVVETISWSLSSGTTTDIRVGSISNSLTSISPFGACTATITYNADGSSTSSGFDGPCGTEFPYNCAPTVSIAYTDEVTATILEEWVISSLPSWGAFSSLSYFSSLEVASAELSTDQTSFSVLESKYQWAHPIPPNSIYKLTWDEVFHPDGGGATSSTPQSYTWDGTTPAGYNPSDDTTWPTSGIFEVNYPSSNGSIWIENLVVSCVPAP